MSNFYDQLGLTPGASPEQVKKSYRLLSKLYHPDNNQDPNAEQEYIKVQTAYETLGNAQKRWEYDQTLKVNQNAEPEFRYEKDENTETYTYPLTIWKRILLWVELLFAFLLALFSFALKGLWLAWQLFKIFIICLLVYAVWLIAHGAH